ncbi:MAG TPA: hypothetical protein QGF58_22565 [Myxococcota bacterium]|nr:hypothetical protein [Myxococcota bacterium]
MIRLLFALSCGDKDNDSASTDDSEVTHDSEPEPFAPTWGDWLTVDGETTDDTCNFEDDDTGAPGGSTITLADAGEGAFTVTVQGDEGVQTFTCALSEMDFSCDTQTVLTIDASDLDPEWDAIITGTATPMGSFSDENTMSGQQVVETTCAGEDCEEVATTAGLTIPCGFTLNFTATYSGG